MDASVLPQLPSAASNRKTTIPETVKLVFIAMKAHDGKKKRRLIRADMNSHAYSKAPSHPVTSGQQQVVGETTHLELGKAGL